MRVLLANQNWGNILNEELYGLNLPVCKFIEYLASASFKNISNFLK